MSLNLVVMFAAAVLALAQGAPQKIIIPEKSTANNSPSHTEIQPLRPQIEKISARAPMVSARPTDGAARAPMVSARPTDGAYSHKDARELPPIEPKQPEGGVKSGNNLAGVLDELETTEEELLNMLGPDFNGDLNHMTFEEIMDALDEAELKEEEEDELSENRLSPEEMKEFEAWEEGEGGEELEEELVEKLTPEETKDFEPWENPQEAEDDGEEMFVEASTAAPHTPVPVVDREEKANDVTWKQLEEQLEEEVDGRRRHRRWHFFTIVLILAVVVIIGYLCVHNRKKNRKGKDYREAVARVKTFENY